MQQSLSRRELLKALTATGGAVVLSTLPDNWQKPVMKVGTLPAFAQVSPIAPATSNLEILGPLGPCDPGGGAPGDLFMASFEYNAPSADIIVGEARVRATFEFVPSGSPASDEVALGPTNIEGNATSGTISVPMCIGFGNDESVNLTMILISANHRESDPLTANIANPGTTGTQGAGTEPQGVIVGQ